MALTFENVCQGKTSHCYRFPIPYTLNPKPQTLNPQQGKTSHCYRINYRAMDRSLTNEEVGVVKCVVKCVVTSTSALLSHQHCAMDYLTNECV
jgi:hypothetical protein